MHQVRYRLVQGFTSLTPATIPPDRDATLASVLSPRQADAFRSLSTYDQAHLLAVHRRLTRAGVEDRDLLAAGLLHDLGKADEHGAVRLTDRVARVLLRKCSPSLLSRMAASPSPRIRRGLYLCVHHPRLGADRARLLDCSDRTAWLIAHHEDRDPGDAADLIRLQGADRG